jgi:putative transposase
MAIAAIQTVFAQPDAASIRPQFDLIADAFETQFPEVAAMLGQAKGDRPAFSAFPEAN